MLHGLDGLRQSWEWPGSQNPCKSINWERMTSFHGPQTGLGLALITSTSCHVPLSKFTGDHSSPLAMLSPWPPVPQVLLFSIGLVPGNIVLGWNLPRPFSGPKLLFWLLALSRCLYVAELRSTWSGANIVTSGRTSLWAWVLGLHSRNSIPYRLGWECLRSFWKSLNVTDSNKLSRICKDEAEGC